MTTNQSKQDMSKLTLEEIASYLPYKVKAQNPISKTIYELTPMDVKFVLNGDKLILRPLSDLDQEFFNTNISWRTNPEIQTIGQIKNALITNILPYNDVIFLVKHHFDINNLIGQGKAIDINTIQH